MSLSVFPVILLAICFIYSVHAQCNICNAATGFACFSDTQYFKCDAAGAIDSCAITTCATGVCDDSIPTTPCSTTNPPTCPSPAVAVQAVATTTTPTTTTTTTTTTAAPAFSATTFCADKTAGSRHAYGNGCTQYVYCYLNDGLKGAIYTCTGTTLFNPTAGYCQSGFTCL